MRPAKSLQKGYIVAMKYYTNIPVSIKAVTEFRVKVLEHKAKDGIKSTLDAFSVSRSTVYAWQKRYLASRKRPSALVPKSTKPRRVRRSKIPSQVNEEIIRLR